MRARMTMGLDTLFGNTAVLTIEAELDNPHERTNNILLRDMAQMLANGIAQIRAQSEGALAAKRGHDSAATKEIGQEWREEEESG